MSGALQAFSSYEFEQFTQQTIQTLKPITRGRECVEALKQLFVVLSTHRYIHRLPEDLVHMLYSILTEPQQGPPRLRLLCAYILRENGANPALRVESFDPPVDRKQIAAMLPLLIATGGRKLFRLHFDKVLRWVIAAEHDVRLAALLTLASFVKEGLVIKEATAIDIQFREILRNASTVSAPQASSLAFWKSSTPTPCTELDGTNIRDFFTVLNLSQNFTSDQLLNIHGFSLLHAWLSTNFLPFVDGQGRRRKASRVLSEDVKDAIIRYCLRLTDQFELTLSVDPASGKIAEGDFRLVDAALVEAVRVLDLVCKIDPTPISKLLPVIKRVYNRNVAGGKTNGFLFAALMQFFLNHSEVVMYDPEPVYSAFFLNYLNDEHANHHVAYEALRFCVDNREAVARRTAIFSKYFPVIFKLAAWSPHALACELADLVPVLTNPGTFIEVFHMILDLPFMAAALERSKYEPDAPVPPAAVDQMGEAVLRLSRNRALYNYVLRNEAGLGAINFWSSTTMPLLLEFCKGGQPSVRVVAAARLTTVLLAHFFDTLVTHGTEANLLAIIPVVFERTTQLYPIDGFKRDVRKILVERLLAVFDRHPTFVFVLRKQIVEFIENRREEGKEELLLTICWAIGEYATPLVDAKFTPDVLFELYEALELFAFEANLAISSRAFDRETVLEFSAEKYNSRLMTVLMAAIAKIAARNPDLTPRALVCLAKIVKSHKTFNNDRDASKHGVVLQRASELVRLLKYPSVASAILDPARRAADLGESHVDPNSSLPFILHSSALAAPPPTSSEAIHPFTLLQ